MNDNSFRQTDYKYLSKMKAEPCVDTCLGMPPETLTCVLHILGARSLPKNLRGYIEALGAGIEIGPNDLILRGSRYSTDKEGRILFPLDEPIKERTELSLSGKGTDCIFYPIGDYRSVLVFPGKAQEIEKIKTFPASGGEEFAKAPIGFEPAKKAFDYFKNDTDCIIPWAQSIPQNLNIKESELLEAPGQTAFITATNIIRGIARLTGSEIIPCEGITGDTDTPLGVKLEATLKTAKTHKLTILHINGADEAGHRKKPKEKQEFIKKVDENVIRCLLETHHEITVISDHGTDPYTGAHTGEKQPLFTRKYSSGRP